jgi:trk system potassium uptake protein TrkA
MLAVGPAPRTARRRPSVERRPGVHVIVVGCGRVGAGLAGHLGDAGHSVAVIDKQPAAFRRLPETFRGRRMVGVGFDRELLLSAGIDRADAVAAVTSGDNSNIVVARIAREAFEVPTVVARIFDARRAVIYERLGVPTVATIEWSTRQVLRRIIPDAPGTEWADPTDQLLLVERPLSRAWEGTALASLEEPGTVRVVACTREGVGRICDGSLGIEEGDVAWLAVRRDALAELDRRLRTGPDRGGR